MRLRRHIKILAALLIGVLLPAAVSGRIGHGKPPIRVSQAAKKSPTGAYYTFHRNTESSTEFNLSLSDGDETVVTEAFSLDRLRILQSVMAEAKKFALTEEAVGIDGRPITTRLSDKQEDAFFVDVAKLGKESQVFITLASEGGRLTVQAGTINRGNKVEEGFFSDLLTRLESALPRTPKPVK